MTQGISLVVSSVWQGLFCSFPQLGMITTSVIPSTWALTTYCQPLKGLTLDSFVPNLKIVSSLWDVQLLMESEFHSHNLSVTRINMDCPSIPTKRAWLLPNNRGNIHDFYQVESKEIASGQFGKVFKGRLKGYTSSLWRAVKRIPKKLVTDKAQLLNQIDIMSSLDHPNISRLFETFQDDHYIYLISQLCEGGQLFDKILEEGYLTEQQARGYFLQLMSAVSYLHSQEIAHRDIKPENLLFLSRDKNSPLKLIDFGLSTRFLKTKPNSMKDTVGTAFYMAPEVLNGVYDQRCDVWSVGVILYLMVAGCQPFNGETDEDVQQLVRKMDYSFDIPQLDQMTDNLKKLLSLLLTDATKRISADVALRHAWAVAYNLEAPTLNMDSLCAFTGYGKLKRLSLAIMVSQANHTELQDISFNFKLSNYSNTGTLYNDELKTALQRQSCKPSQAQIYEVVASLDPTGLGKISFNEFAASSAGTTLSDNLDMVRLSFQLLDVDQDSKISRQDLQDFLSKSQCKFEGPLVGHLIQEGDNNRDGVIDLAEYTLMMQGKPKY